MNKTSETIRINLALPYQKRYEERVAALKKARGALSHHGSRLTRELAKLRKERQR